MLTACGGSGDDTVNVFAASSLTDAFDAIERAYEADHGDVDVVVSYGGSSSLAGQIEQGAPAGVFAAADLDTMRRLVDAGEIDGVPEVFATNRLMIAVEPGNPLDVTSVDDLADSDLVVVVAAPDVPAGRYATVMFERAGVVVTPASFELNVRAVAGKVALGEADAGIVYESDVVAAEGRIDGVKIADDINVTAEYAIAVTRAGAGVDDARRFVDFVLGADGRAALLDAGLGTP